MSKDNVRIGGSITQFNKNYIASILQMGVPILDVDWNNFQDLVLKNMRETLKLVGGNQDVFYDDAMLVEKVDAGTIRLKYGTMLYKGFIFQTYADKLIVNKDYNIVDEDGSGAALNVSEDTNVYLKLYFRYVDHTEDTNLKHPLLQIMNCARLQLSCDLYVASSIEADTEPTIDSSGYWDMSLNIKIAEFLSGNVVDHRNDYDLSVGLIDQIVDNRDNLLDHENTIFDAITALHGIKIYQEMADHETEQNAVLSPKAIYDYIQQFEQGMEFKESVLDRQTDGTTDPGASPSDTDRYLLEDVASKHANFGTIDKFFDGEAATLQDDDVVEYRTLWSEFRIERPTNGSFLRVEDENLYYAFNGTAWEDFTQYKNLEDLLDTDISPAVGEDGKAVYYDHSSTKFKLKTVAEPVAIPTFTVTSQISATITHGLGSSVLYLWAIEDGTGDFISPHTTNATDTDIDIVFDELFTGTVCVLGGQAFTAGSLLQLTDTPDVGSYTDEAGSYLRVADDELGMEFDNNPFRLMDMGFFSEEEGCSQDFTYYSGGPEVGEIETITYKKGVTTLMVATYYYDVSVYIDYIDLVVGGDTYRKTFTYSGSDVTNITITKL